MRNDPLMWQLFLTCMHLPTPFGPKRMSINVYWIIYPIRFVEKKKNTNLLSHRSNGFFPSQTVVFLLQPWMKLAITFMKQETETFFMDELDSSHSAHLSLDLWSMRYT
jgi:hypothetical protein